MYTNNDYVYMKRVLFLAKKAKGLVKTNPMVGCVIVKDEKIIAEGYHHGFGLEHAEVNAINNANGDIEGATMYINLEPCCHYGKRPPCTDAIINSKIKKIYVALKDPNPLVCGKGIEILRSHNIEIDIGLLQEEARNLNRYFLHFITKKRPFVILKSASSLDGKIATSSNESKWITSEKARQHSRRLRSDLDAIMVGVNTVLCDNPKLTTRIATCHDPIRIVVDSNLRIDLNSNILNHKSDSFTLIACTKDADKDKIKQINKKRLCKVIIANKKNDRVDLIHLMQLLAKENISSILLEGGSTLNYSMLEENLVDEVYMYYAPIIIGGMNAKSIVGSTGFLKLENAKRFKDITTEFIGSDILLRGRICLQE